jgi:membrane protease YdiL (CAAX protease family)
MSDLQAGFKSAMKSNHDVFEFFQFRKIALLSPGAQITLISVLYVTMTLGYYFSVQSTGKMDGYSPNVSLLFVPIYEELIFRGLGLKCFENRYGTVRAIIFTSILFGLWHLKIYFGLLRTIFNHK